MYTVIGKVFLHGVTGSGEPYEYYRVYCTVTPSSDEVRSGFEGLKTKAFNFSPGLFNQIQVGVTFEQPLFNEARLDKDRLVCYLIQ